MAKEKPVKLENSQVTEEDLAKWHKLKEKIKQLSESEKDFREWICSTLVSEYKKESGISAEKVIGSAHCKIGEIVAVVKIPQNEKIKDDDLLLVFEDLEEDVQKAFNIKSTYKKDLRKYNALDDDQKRQFDRFVVTTPGTMTLEISKEI